MCSFVLLLACLLNHLSTYIAINQAHFFFFNKKATTTQLKVTMALKLSACCHRASSSCPWGGSKGLCVRSFPTSRDLPDFLL